MYTRKFLPVLLCLLGYLVPAKAQSDVSANRERWRRYEDSVVASKVGKPFITQSTRFYTTDGSPVDFAQLPHVTVACFGMYGCAPCLRELPVFVKLARQYPDIDFLYITHDGAAMNNKEFEAALGSNYNLPPNYRIWQLAQDTMKQLHIHLGYPAKYVLDKNGIVQYFRWGGEPSAMPPEEVEKIYSTEISKYSK